MLFRRCRPLILAARTFRDRSEETARMPRKQRPKQSVPTLTERRRETEHDRDFQRLADVLRTNLTLRRKGLGWSTRELAAKAGLSHATVNMLETGRLGRERTLIRFSMTAVNALARAMQTPVWLFFVPGAFDGEICKVDAKALGAALSQAMRVGRI